MTPPRAWAVIAGGGTAGHVHPALAVADELVARGHDRSSIHFVGGSRGLESELVPRHGYRLTALPGRGIVRRLDLENVRSAAALGVAVWRAFRLLGKLRPAVLVSVGGYASVPSVVAAVVRRVPIVVMEQNAVPGAANRFAGRWARVCAVSFPGTDLPHARHTGNPSARPILGVDRRGGGDGARRRLDVEPGRRLVTAFGGSLGSQRINQAIIDACPALAARADLTIRHVIGDRDWARFGEHRVDGGLQYQPVRYEHAMHDVYEGSAFVIARAGATSVAEIAVTGTPSVLVPLPGAPGDHQTLNARALSDIGAALLVADSELDGPRVVQLVEELLGDGARLQAMGDAARTVGRRDATSAIADLVEEHARAR